MMQQSIGKGAMIKLAVSRAKKRRRKEGALLEFPQCPFRQNLLLKHFRNLKNSRIFKSVSKGFLLREREREREYTFLIAIESPVILFFAEQTTPYAPVFQSLRVCQGLGRMLEPHLSTRSPPP